MNKYTIAAVNLKGKSFAHGLDAVNIVRGKNWSGKSTIIAALKLALIGYDPKLGKRPGDTAKLMTGENMSVALKGDGVSVERKWKRTPTGATLKTEGADDIAPSILLDIAEWFAMTAAQRRSYVLKSFGGGKLEDIDASMSERLQSISPATVYPESLAEKQHLIELNEYWCGERDHNELPLAEWFDEQIKAIKERIKTWTDTVTRTTSVVEQIQNERINNPAGLPGSNVEKIANAKTRLSELHNEAGRVASIGRDMEAQRIALNRAGDIPDNLDELIAENDLALRQSTDAVKFRGDKLAALGNPSFKLETLQRKSDGLGLKLEQLVRLKTELESELAKDIPMPKCCKKCDPVVREFLLADIQKRYEEVRSLVETTRKELHEIDRELPPLRTLVEESKALIAQMTEFQKQHGQLVATGQLLAHKAKVRDSVKSHAALDGLRAPEAISEDIGRVSLELAKLEESEMVRAHMLRRDKNEAQALTEKDTAIRSLEVDKLGIAILEDEQKQYVSRAFDPLVAVLSKFTDGLLPFKIAHREGELGYVGPRSQWVSHSTFSGAEAAITYAGLGVALATQCRMKIVMLDELLVSTENKLAIGSRMAQLIQEGVIDVFVAVDTTSDKWADVEHIINV